MEETSNYKYKFLDGYAVSKKVNLVHAAMEATRCLESEGVTIDPASFIKCVDVYLRVIGMCRSEKSDEFPPINIVVGLVAFKEFDFGDHPTRVELCQNLFSLINECVDEDHKFPVEDIEAIKANIPIVMKEVTHFCNDIVNCIYDEFTGDNVYAVTALVNTKGSGDNHLFGMQIGYDDRLDTIAINIESSVLVPFSEDTGTGIVISSFTEEVKESIMKRMSADTDSETVEEENAGE